MAKRKPKPNMAAVKRKAKRLGIPLWRAWFYFGNWSR
jgi:hypothetical protein